MNKDIRYLLKDKYGWTELSINKYFDGVKSISHPKINIDIERLENGEPLAYIIGWVEFLGSKIHVNENVLIPRPETEYWVDLVINRIKATAKKNRVLRVLDLGCGSGCIGISALRHLQEAHVTFVDISSKAIEQTKANLISCKISDTRYSIIKSNLFDLVQDNYDLILTNPPYVSTKNTNPDLSYEPNGALYAGEDGLDIIRKLLKEFPKHLKMDGQIYIEIGNDQKEELEKITRSKYKEIEFIKDQNDLYRVLRIVP